MVVGCLVVDLQTLAANRGCWNFSKQLREANGESHGDSLPLIDDQIQADGVHHVAARAVILHDVVAMHDNVETLIKLDREGGPRSGPVDGDPLLDRDSGLHLQTGREENFIEAKVLYEAVILQPQLREDSGPSILHDVVAMHNNMETPTTMTRCHETLGTINGGAMHNNVGPLQLDGAQVAHNARDMIQCMGAEQTINLVREGGPVDGDPLRLKYVDEGESLDRDGGLHLQPGREETFAESHVLYEAVNLHPQLSQDFGFRGSSVDAQENGVLTVVTGTSTAETLGPNGSDCLACGVSLHSKSCVDQQPGGVSSDLGKQSLKAVSDPDNVTMTTAVERSSQE
ncbi:Lysophosphatidic acid phosphatase type 6 [Sesbania bispinosa]|nr:Lysophosphatidic acid phosphatase type 6 [Sesbania bispinosa]